MDLTKLCFTQQLIGFLHIRSDDSYITTRSYIVYYDHHDDMIHAKICYWYDERADSLIQSSNFYQINDRIYYEDSFDNQFKKANPYFKYHTEYIIKSGDVYWDKISRSRLIFEKFYDIPLIYEHQ